MMVYKYGCKSRFIRSALLLYCAVHAGACVDEVSDDAVTKNSVEICFSLEENIEYEIKTGKNDENYNVLVIKDGKASIVDADCPDGICEDYIPVCYVGETIICLPHKVVIEIVGDNTDMELDAAI